MTTFSKRSVSRIFFALPLFAMPFSPSSSAQGQDQETQVIELTAKKYEYSPSPVHVKAGTKVQLKITATDHDHGFKIGTAPVAPIRAVNLGLFLPLHKIVGSLKKEKQQRLNSWRKHPARTRSSAAIAADWATEA